MFVRIQDVRRDKTGPDVRENDRHLFHAGQLRKGRKIGALHLFGGRVGRSRPQATRPGDGGDDCDIRLVAFAVGVRPYIIEEMVYHPDHPFTVGAHRFDFLFSSSSRF